MPQGTFVEDNDVIQALLSQGAGAPHKSSASGFSALSALHGCSFPQVADGMLLRKCNLYHVTDNAARYPRERFRNLPTSPLSRGMRRHVELHGMTPMVAQYYEDKQQAKADCRYDQKINRHQLLEWFSRKVRHPCEGGLR